MKLEQHKGSKKAMNNRFNNEKIYFCEDGGSCFVCVGKDTCKNYKYRNIISKIFKKCIRKKKI